MLFQTDFSLGEARSGTSSLYTWFVEQQCQNSCFPPVFRCQAEAVQSAQHQLHFTHLSLCVHFLPSQSICQSIHPSIHPFSEYSSGQTFTGLKMQAPVCIHSGVNHNTVVCHYVNLGVKLILSVFSLRGQLYQAQGQTSQVLSVPTHIPYAFWSGNEKRVHSASTQLGTMASKKTKTKKKGNNKKAIHTK